MDRFKLLHYATLIILFTSFPFFSFSQAVTLTGTVKDMNGNPLQGASVTPKGSTTNGTSTLADGSFSLQVSGLNGIVEVTNVGFKSQTIELKGTNNITVMLQESASHLADVVVVGYGTQKKSNLTGAVASIGNKDFKNQPLSNLANSIQGKLSGINVTSPSGTPGAGLLVSIRGAQKSFVCGRWHTYVERKQLVFIHFV